jgi:methylmalonyl-CoA mutase N-terminal domain/subunit
VVWRHFLLAGPQNLAIMSDKLGKPGEFPYTRGIYTDMYRTRLWTMRQYAGFGTAEQSNRRYHYLLSQGTTGLSVAFDLPTQMGLDADDPMAAGEVGRVGVAVSSLADMEELFRGIPLQDVSTSMTINSTAAILLAFYALVARRQGADLGRLSGTIQNDILKEYIARGTYIYPPRPSCFDFMCRRRVRPSPPSNPMSTLCGPPFRPWRQCWEGRSRSTRTRATKP